MADHGHHDPGGHELEAINTKFLFRLMISLSVVTLLASYAVVQWFYSQRAELEERNAEAGSYQLIEHKTKMAADLAGVDKVAKSLVSNPKLLQAPAPPPGWVHPDDLVGGPKPAAVPAEPTPEPKPAEPTPTEPIPVDGTPTGDKPADEKPADEKPAEKPADKPADKPANDKPAEPKGN